MGTFKSRTSATIDQAKSLFGKKVDKLVEQKDKALEMISGVKDKLAKVSDNTYVKKMTEPLSVFIRMVKAHFNGSHKLSNTTLGLILLALVYFISPLDIIPDFLGLFGFADDVSVIMAVYVKLKDEVEQFLEWERTQE